MTTRDPHLPSVHLRPPCHWVNDPNGLVFHDGYYHVFFQYNPHSARHADMHWGHWRSPDLLSWELLPVALAPTPGRDDADGVWSGNAVSTSGTLVAFYSAKRDDRWWQPVAAATSRDGVRFSKAEGLLVPEPPADTVMFRDPYVWRDGNRWRMLVGAGLDDGRGAALQYSSDDLRSWTYLGPYLARAPEPLGDGGDTEEGWECVQYAAFEGSVGALLFSAWDPVDGAARTGAYVGEDRGGSFHVHSVQPLDHGPDLYAPALLHAPDGRWLLWAWVWEARDETRVGGVSAWSDEVGWAGMLSLPREVTVTEGGLRQRPAREVDELRGDCLVDLAATVAAHEPLDLGPIDPSADLVTRLERSVDGRAATGLRVATSADGREHLDLRLDPGTGDLVADRSAASLDPRAKGGGWRIPTGVRPGEGVEIRAVVDHSVLEVFISTGEALTLRFYPTAGDQWRLQARTSGHGEAGLRVSVWNLAPLATAPR